MKIVCIDNGDYFGVKFGTYDSKSTTNLRLPVANKLTLGKIYDIILHLPNSYRIINDKGEVSEYLKIRFITLEEHRSRILNNLIE